MRSVQTFALQVLDPGGAGRWVPGHMYAVGFRDGARVQDLAGRRRDVRDDRPGGVDVARRLLDE